MAASGGEEGGSATASARGGMKPRRLRGWIRGLAGGTVGLVRWFAIVVAVLLLVLIGVRAYLSTQGPPLKPWHIDVPEELDADAIERADWPAYVAAEDAMFDAVHRELQREMKPADRTPINRYHDGSLSSPLRFERDWNRSFVLEPEGAVTGVAVLLHGLTDAPYSMRTLAQLYRQRGFVAIVPRLPGHGTVPAGLTREGRKEWNATVDMAMREAHRRAGGKAPVHLVGYSNGAALAMLHVMRRIERGERSDATRIVLLSPMVEVNRFARYAGLAGLPAIFGRYARSAWLDLLPEFNPFKYNSFPVHAARESYLVTADLHAAIETVARQQRLGEVPPILGFQSAVDDTVSARGVMTGLFDRLADNGSELVLFDVNRSRVISPMFRAATDWPDDALQAPRRYTLTVVGVTSPNDANAVARSRPAGASAIVSHPTGLRYPVDVFSLSHVALPFPGDDPLYGNQPSGQGMLQLGAVAVRGERNALVVSQDSLSRLTHNPFHAYMLERIAADLPAR